MAKNLSEVEQEPTYDVANVVFHGEELTIPETMNLDAAIELLQRRKLYDEQVISITDTIDVFPMDGAHALAAVLKKKYGWAQGKAIRTWFGDKPPELIQVEVDVGKTTTVPWGHFSLPNIHGTVATGWAEKDGRMVFQMAAKILRRHEPQVRELFQEVRDFLRTGSIYKGKAITIRFKDDDGDTISMPTPRFIDTDVDETKLVYSDSVERALHTNLFTPISRVADLAKNGIPIKRGILLGGTYGTGKTLAAKVASKLARQAGVTYIYVQRSDELADAINFGRLYQDPAVVIFCEDIDGMVAEDRSDDVNEVLNLIDGVDTKNLNMIVVLTTNFVERINKALLRPGRLDAVINVTPPDAKAVERLIRVYGGNMIKPETDLTAVGEKLKGTIPAVVVEVVKRAKLSQLSLQKPGSVVNTLSAEALLDAANTIDEQRRLLEDQAEEITPSDILHGALTNMVRSALNGTEEELRRTRKALQQQRN